MCGIVGVTAGRNVTPILMEGLRRLEYRGYDSAGIAAITESGIHRLRAVGKVEQLSKALEEEPVTAFCGIAHTRWATHGKPTRANAHPHLSHSRLALVHNGIIENHVALRKRLESAGYAFESETDTEVIVHLLDHLHTEGEPFDRTLRRAAGELSGAYAIAVVRVEEPGVLYAARMGSPLVIGVGSEENFLASDPLALLQVTDRFVYLENGEIARIERDGYRVTNADDKNVQREPEVYLHGDQAASKGKYRHFMLKEIHEQPEAIRRTIEGKLGDEGVLVEALGPEALAVLPDVRQVHIVACGTSYHAGLVARYWIESHTGIPCTVEVASEYRYRNPVVPPGSLFIGISQSGETADTLAALRYANGGGYLATLGLCNMPGSTLVRESRLRLMTDAGPEIGVASTKAFTTQLVALYWFTLVLGRTRGLDDTAELAGVRALKSLAGEVERALELEPEISRLAAHFSHSHNAIFLGRGAFYPVAMEGALKLKEISYIHAEAFPAGELKHGPLALIDEETPVISVAAEDELLEKLQSNLAEVHARGGRLINFIGNAVEMEDGENIVNVRIGGMDTVISPVVATIPLQLLAYHVALIKGTDVDKPRNLAKSVTVE